MIDPTWIKQNEYEKQTQNFCFVLTTAKEKVFLYKIIIDNEKWVYMTIPNNGNHGLIPGKRWLQ